MPTGPDARVPPPHRSENMIMQLTHRVAAAALTASLALATAATVAGCGDDDDGQAINATGGTAGAAGAPGAPGVAGRPGAAGTPGVAVAVDGPAVDRARADLNALYKGDYRRAFVEKNPDLFLRHIPDNFTSEQVDGSKADAALLRQFFPGVIASIERTLEHNVTLEQVVVVGEQIRAVVTLTTVTDRRSPAGALYHEVASGTYVDTFERSADGTLLEVRGEQLRQSTTAGPRP
jgi:hypothetical protein